MSKTCNHCKEELSIDLFYNDRTKSDGKMRQCKKCHHKQKAQSQKLFVERTTARNRGLILEYLKTHPCVDCGETDIIVLQFDHIRGEKRFQISSAVYTKKWHLIEDEIKKCEVRCANCHKRRTTKQLNWYNAVFLPENFLSSLQK